MNPMVDWTNFGFSHTAVGDVAAHGRQQALVFEEKMIQTTLSDVESGHVWQEVVA